MKKLLGIVVLGLLLSGNAYAEILNFSCKNTPDNGTHEFVRLSLNKQNKSIQIHYKWNENYYNKYSGTRISSSTPMEKKYYANVKAFDNAKVV